MDKIEPRIPNGFQELLPQEQILFNQMLGQIRGVYESFGFTPIETPALELAEVILAKGGGDTEKEIFRFGKGDSDYVMPFDLTIPLARYVAQHFNDLVFPFRRYQIQKVWRAERPQKGRFREFYQCDFDVIGTENLLNDAEIVAVISATFIALDLPDFVIKINNRKILNGFFEELEISDENKIKVLRAIDKLDKQGEDTVTKELAELGLPQEKINRIFEFIKAGGINKQKTLEYLKSLKIKNAVFAQGLMELKTVLLGIAGFGVPDERYQINLAIARGLDYYTGTVYETFLNNLSVKTSVCSGGRYDDLAQYYTDKKLSGVGVSIGFTRLFSLLKDASLLKFDQIVPTKILIAPMADGFMDKCLAMAQKFRQANINTEVSFTAADIGKQLKYASRLKIPFVAIIGENETKEGKITLKDMAKGEQKLVTIEEAIQEIKR